jgi:hypothetical protein
VDARSGQQSTEASPTAHAAPAALTPAEQQLSVVLRLIAGSLFIAACNKLGYHGITRPHGSEPWHINVSEDPRPRLLERGLIG